jgi:uncharacterized protein
MVAASCGHTNVIELLADAGANLDERNSYGWTALWYACAYGRLDAVGVLIRRGADPTIASRTGNTPLMSAAWNGCLPVITYLLDTGRNDLINARNHEGATALFHACGYNKVRESPASTGPQSCRAPGGPS